MTFGTTRMEVGVFSFFFFGRRDCLVRSNPWFLPLDIVSSVNLLAGRKMCAHTFYFHEEFEPGRIRQGFWLEWELCRLLMSTSRWERKASRKSRDCSITGFCRSEESTFLFPPTRIAHLTSNVVLLFVQSVEQLPTRSLRYGRVQSDLI